MAATVGVTSAARATTVSTPYGPADSSCVHEIPDGAAYDVTANASVLNGVVLEQFQPCSISVTGNSSVSQISSMSLLPGSAGSGPGAGGWYEYVGAPATPLDGLTQFNDLDVTFYVPNQGATDGSVLYFFPALQNYNSSGTLLALYSPCFNGAQTLILVGTIGLWHHGT